MLLFFVSFFLIFIFVLVFWRRHNGFQFFFNFKTSKIRKKEEKYEILSPFLKKEANGKE